MSRRQNADYSLLSGAETIILLLVSMIYRSLSGVETAPAWAVMYEQFAIGSVQSEGI